MLYLTDPGASCSTNSEQGKGLFTLGMIGITMAPLKLCSDRADEIEADLPTGQGVPGLAEQYAEQAARIRSGAANAEFLTIPGFYSFPSACRSKFKFRRW